jgi:hypothetical protein
MNRNESALAISCFFLQLEGEQQMQGIPRDFELLRMGTLGDEKR